ncbi:MAG: hypothetical protein MJ168_11655 [Clostridia bacterium]|nr:hypothetical protein [Clostridia bacterium]
MPVYKIADLKVGFEPKYDLLKNRSSKYLCDEPAEFNIGIKDELFTNRPEYCENITDDCMEYLWMGTAFNLKLLEYKGMFLHSSTVVVDGKAYSFSAPCGTGKSTHTGLWMKLLGEKAFIINDDKAAYRKIDDKYYVYGTPFSGKHEINVDTRAELKGICFVEQAKENSIERIPMDDAVSLIISQTVRPSVPQRMEMMCDFIDELIRDIPIYRLKCNIELEAAKLSYETMSNY